MTPLFYDPRQNVEGVNSFSPSAGKPKRLMELLAHYDFRSFGPQNWGTVAPVTQEDLCLVHCPNYIRDLFALRAPNGFGDCNPDIPESILWTVGSLLSAARHAMKHPAVVTMSPTSGFHHADYDFASGYCTCNGLVVVAAKLLQENPQMRISIIDADAHYGDGTASLLKRHKHIGKQVLHFTSGQHFYGDRKTEDALDFQVWLHSAIEEINAYQPDLVLYQAGGDQHRDDALRSGFLTTQEMIQRDRAVFRGIRAPLVWNLAGGYSDKSGGSIFQDPVLQIHRNTLDESNASITHREEFFNHA